MSTIVTWPRQAESWLDEHGKGAWIALMIVGFIVFWPLGLALLAYLIWSKRMFNGNGKRRACAHRHAFRPSGNSAFDAYKADTLQRLEEEQQQFEGFLQRLRDAKDKAEFDQFMNERESRHRQDRADGDLAGA